MNGQLQVSHQQALQTLGEFEQLMLGQVLPIPYNPIAVFIKIMKTYIEIQEAQARACKEPPKKASLEVLEPPPEKEKPPQPDPKGPPDGERQKEGK